MNHYQNFINNLLYISKKNQKSNYKLGINKFSDLSLQEFRAKYANLNLNNRNKAQIKYKLYTPNRKNDEPESFNWVDEGVVNEIQDQGFCGSCWAFGTISNIEGVYALKTGELLKLSEQQLVDCDENDLGCNGGDPINAFPYIQENGLELEED
jgi:C1A family cysteine protease